MEGRAFDEYVPRKLIGSLYPHPQVDTGLYEFYQLVPQGVMMVAVTIDLREFSRADIERAFAPLDEKLDQLAERGVDVILQTGVPPVVLTGLDFHDRVLARIRDKTGIAATSTINCVIESAKALGLRRLAAANKWTEQMNRTLGEFFARDGIELVGVCNESLPVSEFMRTGPAASMELAYRLGQEALRRYPDADGLYIGGGAWLTVPVAAALEEEFSKPVITNSTAQVWHLLHLLNVWKPIQGGGVLLSRA